MRRLFIAIVVAVTASLKPAWSVLELYRLPIGTALRPMHLGMELLFFGLGTPVLVGALVLLALARGAFPQRDRTNRSSLLTWLLSLLAIALSFVPL